MGSTHLLGREVPETSGKHRRDNVPRPCGVLPHGFLLGPAGRFWCVWELGASLALSLSLSLSLSPSSALVVLSGFFLSSRSSLVFFLGQGRHLQKCLFDRKSHLRTSQALRSATTVSRCSLLRKLVGSAEELRLLLPLRRPSRVLSLASSISSSSCVS